ncbi:MAG: hypothetical protein Q9219_001715 [cf. Caloplaca sp. 3 TL-2023]
MNESKTSDVVNGVGERTPLLKPRTTKENPIKPKTLTISSDEYRSFTIPIPNEYDVEVTSVAVKLYPPPDADTWSQEEEGEEEGEEEVEDETLHKESQASRDATVFLLNVVLFIGITCYIIWTLLQWFGAADANNIIHEDHNHHRLLDLLQRHDTYRDTAFDASDYEPEFVGLDRQVIGRAPDAVATLSNNAPKPTDIGQGDIQYWTFSIKDLQDSHGQPGSPLPLNLTATNTTRLEKDLIQLARKQSHIGGNSNVWLTLSTCDQPSPKITEGTGVPPHLEVYISTTQDNQNPDKERHDQVIDVDEGFGSIALSDVADGIWIGIRAPMNSDFEGVYNYELAASRDAPYATFFEAGAAPSDAVITVWDTDTNSSLLGTSNITNAAFTSPEFSTWTGMEPPFSLYVTSHDDSTIDGMRRSVCGLKKHSRIQDSDDSMVKIGGQPKQLFYVKDLNRSTSYDAIMTLEPSNNVTIGGGGAVWGRMNFTTKSDGNCQIIHSLPFCTNVAYAVPSNQQFMMNMTDLALTYDNHANDAYQNFSKSLQQIPCDTTPSAQYSLARNCHDCDDAYKTWLCAVTIPRCADFSSPSTLTHLHPRNIKAQTFINGTTVPEGPKGSLLSAENKSTIHYGVSRNPMIDERIKPGPYKEMLPCKDLCYHLMQNCPAALQFTCPTEKRGMNYSYGHYREGDADWLCNWPGGNLMSGVGSEGVRWALMAFGLIFTVFVL